MFNLFRKQPTASEIGQLGNIVKRRRERMKVRAKCDEMRRNLGLPEVSWPE